MKKTLTLTAYMAALIFSNSAVSQVSNISSDDLVQYGKQDAYWVAEITCADDSKRVIQRKTDSDEWCGKAVEGFCDVTKEGTANKICDTQYTSSLSLLEAAKEAQSNALQAEQRALKAERAREAERLAADQRIKQQQADREKRAAAEAPLKKQINIEEELILIEQEKLNLRSQELELQRRAVEIEALLEKTS